MYAYALSLIDVCVQKHQGHAMPCMPFELFDDLNSFTELLKCRIWHCMRDYVRDRIQENILQPWSPPLLMGDYFEFYIHCILVCPKLLWWVAGLLFFTFQTQIQNSCWNSTWFSKNSTAYEKLSLICNSNGNSFKKGWTYSSHQSHFNLGCVDTMLHSPASDCLFGAEQTHYTL